MGSGASALAMPKIIFVSKIAMALKALENKAFIQFSELAASLVEADPQVLDLLDTDRAFRKMADNQGVSSEFWRNPEEVRMIREQRAKKAEAAAALEAAQGGARAAKDLGGAPPGMQAQLMGG
jgi:hypothetical protein